MRNLCLSLSIALLPASSLSASKMQLEAKERRPEPIIQPADSNAELAIQQFNLPEGIEATLWAAEPMLANPVAFAFDEQGRLFVAETYRYGSSVLDIRGYMDMVEEDMAFRTVEDRAQGIVDLFGEEAADFKIEGEILRLLEDRDGDGKADTSSVYADGFNASVDGIASGVLARNGDVYFTNIPSLWKFNGTDSSGAATSREELLRGFGVHFGYTGHDFHGLILGPDGKLYFSIGDRGADVTAADGSHISYPDTGAVYRSNLDGTELEVVHHGLRNPQELAFDERGNLFTGDNDCDNGDRERLVQIAEGGDSGWRIGHQQAPLGKAGVWMSESWWKMEFEGRAKFALPPITYIDDGPSGIAYYPGTGLSPEYSGHLFITHFKGSIARSGISTYTLKPKGAWFELDEKKKFFAGILPTDVTFAPDGKLYVLDWVNGWPKPGQGRVYALSDTKHQTDPIIAQTQALISGGMSKRDSNELAKLLAHPNWNVRLEAELELAKRGKISIEIFTTIAKNEAAQLYPRLHATWGLGILAEHGSSKAATTLSQLLDSPTNEVRAQAAKLAGDHKIKKTHAKLVTLLRDEDSRVRYFAAQSLGKFAKPSAAAALIEAARANDDEDAYLSHAIVMGLVGSKNRSVLKTAITDPSKAVRFASLLAYRRLGDSKISRFLKDSDTEIVFEAARAINDAPIEAAYPDLAAMLDSPFANDPILALRAINAHFRLGSATNALALARYAAQEANPETLRLEALTQLQSWPNPLQRDRIIGIYRPLADRDGSIAGKALKTVADPMLASENETILTAYIAALNQLSVTGLADSLYALAADESKPGPSRVAAFQSLVHNNDPQLDALILLASQSNSSELRLATLPIVSERNPKQAAVTLQLMTEGSVKERRTAYTALAKSKQTFASKLLARSLAQLTAGEVPIAAQLELIEATENHPSPEVQTAFKAYQDAVAADPDPIAPYRFALEGGDASKSQHVFMNNQAMACIRCHLVNTPGETVGPNLANVGQRLDRHQLLESVVAPNAAIADGFDNVILTLNDGTSVAGLVEKETDSEITLTLVGGETKTFDRSSVKKRDAMPSSMPAFFGTLLPRNDLRDLIEGLTHLKTDSKPKRTTHGE